VRVVAEDQSGLAYVFAVLIHQVEVNLPLMCCSLRISYLIVLFGDGVSVWPRILRAGPFGDVGYYLNEQEGSR
jgi:hypothetical protein